MLASGRVLGLGAAAYCWHQLSWQSEVQIPEVSNLTELRTAVGFGVLYAVMLFFADWLSGIAGSGGLYVVSLAGESRLRAKTTVPGGLRRAGSHRRVDSDVRCVL